VPAATDASAQSRLSGACRFAPRRIRRARTEASITEAFAQQAYTAVGNRDRKIMRDPYLLGFEIVDKNEENNRLVGVFAFRVSGELLMVPVFYLNGQIKGPDLLYRKPVNRFYPNTEKWVNYFVGRGADETGRSVSRRSNADARIHLGIDRMSRMPGGYKSAADETEPQTEAPVDIQAEWKEACDKSGFSADQFFFADFLVDHGMQKEAAYLASRIPWFGDAIALGGLLDKPLTKRAAAPKQSLEYHVEPPPGASEEQVAAHYTRGFSLVDKRAAESLAAAVESSPISRTWSTLRKPGVNRVAGRDGTFQKVLWAPTTSGGCYDEPVAAGHRGKVRLDHRLVFLEGPDKGCVISYRGGCVENELPLFTDDAVVEKEAGSGIADGPTGWQAPCGKIGSAGPPGVDKEADALFAKVVKEAEEAAEKKAAAEEVSGDSTPQKGKAYVVWLPGLGKLFGEPFRVDSVENTGDVIKLNFDKGSSYGETQCRVILRKDLETTTVQDLTGDAQGNMPRVIGGDAVWIPIEPQLHYEHGMPETAANVSYAEFQPPANFQPLTLATVDDALLTSKMASITIERDKRSGLLSLRDPAGKLRLEDYSRARMAIKLASLESKMANSLRNIYQLGAFAERSRPRKSFAGLFTDIR
jgi:hypothetical protein